MAIPASGTVSLSDIQTEFGGTNPISISEYYSAAGGVPASGEISVSDFYGTSAGVVSLSDYNIFVIDDTIATAEITYYTNGAVTHSQSTSGQLWFDPNSTGIGDLYEIYVSVSSGVTPSGTLNTWLALSSNRTWSVTDAIDDPSSRSSTLAVQIRDAATQTVQDTATVTLTANYFGGGGL
jgi:hypothetical protein